MYDKTTPFLANIKIIIKIKILRGTIKTVAGRGSTEHVPRGHQQATVP